VQREPLSSHRERLPCGNHGVGGVLGDVVVVVGGAADVTGAVGAMGVGGVG
jgi:hypothetical protein